MTIPAAMVAIVVTPMCVRVVPVTTTMTVATAMLCICSGRRRQREEDRSEESAFHWELHRGPLRPCAWSVNALGA